MRRMFPYCLILACSLIVFSAPCYSDDLVVKSCTELVRMAENYQEDLKTVDTMLGSAIEGGSIERVKNYKLRRGVIKQQLELVLKAVEARGCIKSAQQKCSP